MVVEALITPIGARLKTHHCLPFALLFISLAIIAGIIIPLRGAVLAFALMACTPLVWNLLVIEERDTAKRIKLLGIESFTYHKPLFSAFAWLFVGAVIAYAAWFLLLPQPVGEQLFEEQIREITRLRSVVQQAIALQAAAPQAVAQQVVTQQATTPTTPQLRVEHPERPTADYLQRFGIIFGNNAGLLALLLIFSLLYGIGSLYLLLWNASVLGIFIGDAFKANLLQGLKTTLMLVPHGLFEIGGFLIGSIAGGVLSIALMRRSYTSPAFKWILIHVALLTTIAFLSVAIGAALEALYI